MKKTYLNIRKFTRLLDQGLCSEFQMMGAHYCFLSLIQSKTVKFSFSPENILEIEGCNQDLLKIEGCNCTRCTRSNGAPVDTDVIKMVNKHLSPNKDMQFTSYGIWIAPYEM